MAAGTLAIAVAFGVAALPSPSTPVSVSAADNDGAAADVEGEAPTTTTTISTASVPIPAVPSQVRRTPETPAPPSYATAPGVGTVPLSSPGPPVYSSGHPLLTDPHGDAWVDTGATGRGESDPTLDITHIDVTATTSTVTTELRLLDLDRQPLTSFRYGRPTAQRYQMSLLRDGGHFSFYVRRDLGTGAVTAEGLYWVQGAGTDSTGSYTGTPVEGVTATINLKSGIVRATATFEAMNRAVAQSGTGGGPIGRGTGVRPYGGAKASYPHLVESTFDEVAATDPAFTYRLGD